MFLNLLRVIYLRFLLYIFALPTSWVSASTVPLEYGEFKLFQTPVTYDLNTSVSIIDENEGGRTIGYRITAVVGVEPIWSDQETDFLLKFHLESPQVYAVGGKRAEARSAGPARSWFAARLTHGAVSAAYLDDSDPTDLLNYKKSIVSLFQFRAIDGETKETDVSGSCDVVYTSSSLTTIHKIKSQCSEDSSLEWFRHTTYSLSRSLDAVTGVQAREHVRAREHAALSVRAEHALTLQSAARAGAEPARDLAAALQALPPNLKSVPLTLQPDTQKWEWEQELEAALSSLLSAGDGEQAGAGGSERSARAALAALPALAAADAAAVSRVLQDDHYYPVLPVLCRLVGQSGSGAALAAGVSHLQLAGREPARALGAALLAGAARAARPDAAARAALLALARAARDPAVAGHALLAAAAQARRGPPDGKAPVRDLVLKELARCKDDSCLIVRLQALGNLASPDTAEALAQHAAGGSAAVAGAALDAIDALPDLTPRVLDKLQVIAASTGRAAEVRARALQLVLRRSPARLPALARELRAAHGELRRVLWRLAEDAALDVRALPPADRSWHARAAAGTSTVLSRSTGWQLADGSQATLRTAQFAAAGALRRGLVTLELQPKEEELLAVEVWTRGVESLAGGSEEEVTSLEEGSHADSALRGGLRLRIDGVRQPGLQLFDGQAELLGHIWSGAGSSASAVLRGERARAVTSRAPLLAGARLALAAHSVHAFAVDAQAQISLWSRNGRALLELRVGAVSQTRVGLRAPSGDVITLQAETSTAPRLSLDAHMDFYDTVTLCVRAALPPHDVTRRVTSRARGLRRTRDVTRSLAGRTLSLGAGLDRACRDIALEDH